MTYFLLRDYDILPKKELHSSPWVGRIWGAMFLCCLCRFVVLCMFVWFGAVSGTKSWEPGSLQGLTALGTYGSEGFTWFKASFEFWGL